jgi:hypothetical protein
MGLNLEIIDAELDELKPDPQSIADFITQSPGARATPAHPIFV